MNGWREYLCAFPDDDDVTLDRVLEKMSAGSSGALIQSPLPYYLIRLSSAGAAVALTITVPGVLKVDGVTDDPEVLVPWSARLYCEQQIVDLNHGPARWTRLERIEAREDVWKEFHHHWTSYRRQWRQ